MPGTSGKHRCREGGEEHTSTNSRCSPLLQRAGWRPSAVEASSVRDGVYIGGRLDGRGKTVKQPPRSEAGPVLSYAVLRMLLDGDARRRQGVIG